MPDCQRLELMPSLPVWVGSRIDLLKEEMQREAGSGKWRWIPTLPANLILNETQHDEIARHVSDLKALCGPSAAESIKVEAEILVVVTKLMLVLPAPKQNEISAEARGEAYMAALDDLPAWAVSSAVRQWYRGSCGLNEQRNSYDYHWCPAPAELRSIARRELWKIEGRIAALDKLLRAEPLLELSVEHRAHMCSRLGELGLSLIPPVGKDGSDGTIADR
jgi:FAD/FMN-containing dehydrogenase